MRVFQDHHLPCLLNRFLGELVVTGVRIYTVCPCNRIRIGIIIRRHDGVFHRNGLGRSRDTGQQQGYKKEFLHNDHLFL